MNSPEEPSSDARTFARALRDHYIALVAEGFTAQEALDIIGRILAASIHNGEAS